MQADNPTKHSTSISSQKPQTMKPTLIALTGSGFFILLQVMLLIIYIRCICTHASEVTRLTRDCYEHQTFAECLHACPMVLQVWSLGGATFDLAESIFYRVEQLHLRLSHYSQRMRTTVKQSTSIYAKLAAEGPQKESTPRASNTHRCRTTTQTVQVTSAPICNEQQDDTVNTYFLRNGRRPWRYNNMEIVSSNIDDAPQAAGIDSRPISSRTRSRCRIEKAGHDA